MAEEKEVAQEVEKVTLVQKVSDKITPKSRRFAIGCFTAVILACVIVDYESGFKNTKEFMMMSFATIMTLVKSSGD